MTALPAGVVTFLMSDIEASTQLWQREGAAMDRALISLDESIRHHVERCGGVVIKARGEGDSHFAAFHRATDAVNAAVGIQRARAAIAWPTVRVALHAGEADPVGGDYLGALVNRTARLRATAHGGQIVCSRVVAELADGVDGVSLRSLGTHRIRDMAAPIEIFQAVADGLTTDFAPLMTLDTTATTVMTIVVVDQVGSTYVVEDSPDQIPDWQRTLFRQFRSAAADHDGRFVKLLGDGGMVAFEDPRRGVGFARELCERPGSKLRAAVTAGVVEVVEGELSGPAMYEAFRKVRHLDVGDVDLSPLVCGLLGVSTPNSLCGEVDALA